MYRFLNVNARGNFVNDCVVRAISLAEHKTWDETYEKLSDIAQEQGILLDDVDFVEDYLDEHYRRVPHCAKLVREFVEECPCGTYLVTMEGHITVIIDGVIYDTFDCSNRRIWGIWCVSMKSRK